jgi:hypothetical protein
MPSIPSRDQKIINLASQIDLASGELCFRIPSSDGGLTSYLTSTSWCTCPARTPCVHSAAVALRLELARSESGQAS